MQPKGLWQWLHCCPNNGSELLQSSHGGVYEVIIAFGITDIPKKYFTVKAKKGPRITGCVMIAF